MRMKVVTDPRHLHELILEASTSIAVVSSVSAKNKMHISLYYLETKH